MCDQDVGSEITAELQGFPDFIIGNYSDGNLVASLLAYKMGITQVNYHFSLFWYEMLGILYEYIIYQEWRLMFLNFDV